MLTDTPVYLTPREAADRLRVDRQTIYNRIEDGRLEARRIDGTNRWRISIEAVDGLLSKPEKEEK